MIDFTNIEYLKSGNERQQEAYITLQELRIFEELEIYSPLLTGTIPIDIDLPESDLDIICTCEDHAEFSKRLCELFSDKRNFDIKSYEYNGIKTTTAKFISNRFEIEVFGQHIPTRHQNAYRHMLAEHKILTQKGTEFKRQIRELKSSGLKTEPAFAKLLRLKGDPYEALLKT